MINKNATKGANDVTMANNIYLMGYNALLMDHYQEIMNERIELYPETTRYVLVEGQKGVPHQQIQLIAMGDEYDITYLREELEKNPELKAMVFTRARNYDIFRAINDLVLDFPLAVINIAEQPIQPARIWEFLDRVEAKTIHFEWEEGDWDEF